MDFSWWDSRTWQKFQDCQHNSPLKRAIAPTKAKTWCNFSAFPSDSNLTWNLMSDNALEPLVKCNFPSSNYQCHNLFLDILVVPSFFLWFSLD